MKTESASSQEEDRSLMDSKFYQVIINNFMGCMYMYMYFLLVFIIILFF